MLIGLVGDSAIAYERDHASQRFCRVCCSAFERRVRPPGCRWRAGTRGGGSAGLGRWNERFRRRQWRIAEWRKRRCDSLWERRLIRERRWLGNDYGWSNFE